MDRRESTVAGYRRGLLRTFAAGVGMTVLTALGLATEAKKKRKRKKKNGTPACGSGETTCPAGYLEHCCPAGTECCQSRIACCTLERVTS